MGIFDKVSEQQVKDAQYFERGNYIKPGTYIVEVLKVKEGTSRPPKNTGFFVAEMKTLESSNTKSHPIGSTMTWMTMANQDAFLGNVRHFVAAAGGLTFEECGLEALKMSVGEDSPLMGVILQADAINTKTKAEKDFTKVRFTFLAESRDAWEAASKAAAEQPQASA